MRVSNRPLPEQLDDASLENLVYAAFERAKDEERPNVMAVLGMLWLAMHDGDTAALRRALEAYADHDADAAGFVLGPAD